MTRLVWHENTAQLESGIDRGVTFPPSGGGVPWYGLVRVDEVEDATPVESYFIDGVQFDQSSPISDFSAVVESFTYPEILDYQDSVFGFSYRSGNGLHLVYNATFDVPNEKHGTITASTDPNNFIFVLSTTHVTARKTRPFSHLVLMSNELLPLQLREIEDLLYGTPESAPQMPTPQWVMELLDTWTHGLGHGPFGHRPFGGNTS